MAKESTHPVRSGWLKYFLNRDGLMLGSGMFLELLLSISALLIRSAMYSSEKPFVLFFSFISPSQLFLINSCIGFFAATLIAAGLIKLAYRLRITVNADTGSMLPVACSLCIVPLIFSSPTAGKQLGHF